MKCVTSHVGRSPTLRLCGSWYVIKTTDTLSAANRGKCPPSLRCLGVHLGISTFGGGKKKKTSLHVTLNEMDNWNIVS